MVDVNPFSKISWYSSRIKSEWEEVLKKAREIAFISEYEMVKQHLREANVYHMYPHSFDEQIRDITEDGLVFLPILRSKVYNGFSHKHYPSNNIDKDTFVFGVVAETLDVAKKFKEASDNGDHVTQGRLLGYPDCCARFFTDKWKSRVLDPCYEVAVNTEGSILNGNTVTVNGNILLNQILRYFGIRIIPFFPCSYKCKEAIEVANVWEQMVTCLDEETANKIKYLLGMPIKWNLYKNMIYIKTPLFMAVVNGYECKEVKEIDWNAK